MGPPHLGLTAHHCGERECRCGMARRKRLVVVAGEAASQLKVVRIRYVDVRPCAAGEHLDAEAGGGTDDHGFDAVQPQILYPALVIDSSKNIKAQSDDDGAGHAEKLERG